MTNIKQNDITFGEWIVVAVSLAIYIFMTSIILTLMPSIAIPYIAGVALPIMASKWYWILIIPLSIGTGVVGFIFGIYNKGHILGVTQTSAGDTTAHIKPDTYELPRNIIDENTSAKSDADKG